METNICYHHSPSLLQRIESLPENGVIVCNAPSPNPRILEYITDHLSQSSKFGIAIHFPTETENHWSEETLEVISKGTQLILINAKLTSNDSGEQIQLSFSKQYSAAELSDLISQKNAVRKLYTACHLTCDLSEPEPATRTNSDTQGNITASSDELLAEVEQLTRSHSLSSNDSLALFLFKGEESPAMLEQIGLGRAVTFAAIGAGAGNTIDLSPEDQYYHHLALWDKKAKTLVGAYRIGFIESIIKQHGKSGLYLDHIFHAQPEYYESLGKAMELSRSYILPSYQKNPQMLDALWKGIGLAAKTNHCYTMYGSVTISASFTPLSKAILVDTLDRYHSDTDALRNSVKSKNPFVATTQNHQRISDAWADQGVNRLNSIIEEIENRQRSIPPLIRYYVALGAKFSAFQVEASFNNAIYCLLRVDLQALPSRYKKRFLGE